MAISYIATGITASSDTATPFANQSYTLPTGHTSGDLLIACYGGKPYNTVPSTPTGYTAQSGGANGTTAMGAGTGSVYAVAFTKTHDGSESNPASTFSAQYSPAVRAMLAIRSAGATWTVTSTNGSDSTSTGTTFSATGASNLNYAADDIVVVLLVHNDDSSSDSAFGISIAGCTLGTVAQRLTGTLTTSTGNDARMYLLTARVLSGTSSAAPVVTATTGSGDSDGQAVFLRVQGAVWGSTSKRNNAEDQASGTTLTDSNAGTSPNTNFQYTGSVLFSDAQAVGGSKSFKFPASTGAYIDWEVPDRVIGTKRMAWRCYWRAAALDTGSNRTYFIAYSLTGGTERWSLFLTPGGLWTLYTPGGNLELSDATMSANTWYRLEVQAEIGSTTSNGFIEAQVYDASGTLLDSVASSAANLSTADFGEFWITAAGHTNDFYVDDLHLSWDERGVIGPNPTATGSLELGGSATATQGGPTASGEITLGGTASAAAATAATGSIALGGSAAAAAPATASGSIALGGSATAKAAATASGSLELGGSAGWTAPTVSGGLDLGGSANAKAAATAAGSLALDGAAAARGAATATGSISLGGSATGQAPASTTGSLTLGGSAAAQAPATATGSLSLSGAAAVEMESEEPEASGSLTLGGSAAATAPATASGSLTLGATGGATTPAVALGTISLSALATAAADAAAVGLLTLTGTVHVHPPASMAGQDGPSAGMNAALVATATATPADAATATLTPASTATATITGTPSTTATIERS